MSVLYIHLYLLSLEFKTVTLLLFHNILVHVRILLHKMAPFCMNTAKNSSGGGPLDPPSNTTLLDLHFCIHINTKKNQYQNIPATK